jgi:DNA-binding response OmpR family regulator
LKKNILIAYDELKILIPFQFLLERHGYNVMTAQTGDHALELIYQNNPDLVLLDIKLPGINGHEICETVRLHPEYRNIKIIVLTAGGSDVDVAKGLALGVDAYITKPIMNDELVAKVKALLAKSIKNPWHTQSMISSDYVITGISL